MLSLRCEIGLLDLGAEEHDRVVEQRPVVRTHRLRLHLFDEVRVLLGVPGGDFFAFGRAEAAVMLVEMVVVRER